MGAEKTTQASLASSVGRAAGVAQLHEALPMHRAADHLPLFDRQVELLGQARPPLVLGVVGRRQVRQRGVPVKPRQNVIYDRLERHGPFRNATVQSVLPIGPELDRVEDSHGRTSTFSRLPTPTSLAGSGSPRKMPGSCSSEIRCEIIGRTRIAPLSMKSMAG